MTASCFSHPYISFYYGAARCSSHKYGTDRMLACRPRSALCLSAGRDDLTIWHAQVILSFHLYCVYINVAFTPCKTTVWQHTPFSLVNFFKAQAMII